MRTAFEASASEENVVVSLGNWKLFSSTNRVKETSASLDGSGKSRWSRFSTYMPLVQFSGFISSLPGLWLLHKMPAWPVPSTYIAVLLPAQITPA